MEDIGEQFARLDAGLDVDLSLRKGVLISTKTAFAFTNGRYGIFHAVDGTVVAFTREGMQQVLEGTRGARDGDG